MEKIKTIWVIALSEPMPVDSNQRLGRAGSLCEYLSGSGHDVVWWRSGFSHGKKDYELREYTVTELNSHWTAVSLYSDTGYKKNVSFDRIRYYQKLAEDFKKHYDDFPAPDLILSCWPSIVVTDTALGYGEAHHVPVVVDIRDLWPDIFERAFPGWCRPAGRLALAPLKKYAAGLLKRAYGITGVNKYALKFGCEYAGREAGPHDAAFYLGNQAVSDDEIERLRASVPDEWRQKGLSENAWNVCFIGSLRFDGLDLKTLILAVKKLHEKYPDIHLGIAGEGDSRAEMERAADGSDAITFLGWQDGTGMNRLMSISRCGAYSLTNTKFFQDAFSNKIVQYICFGLPVLNSLTGMSREILDENNAGLTYEEENVEDCAAKIETLYLNEKLRTEMAHNAKALFDRQFDMENINRSFAEYFDRVIEDYRIEKGQQEI